MLPLHNLEDPVVVQKKQRHRERRARSRGYDSDFRRNRISTTLLRVHIDQSRNQSRYRIKRYDSSKKTSVTILLLSIQDLSMTKLT